MNLHHFGEKYVVIWLIPFAAYGFGKYSFMHQKNYATCMVGQV
jgi:hypothetical protein